MNYAHFYCCSEALYNDGVRVALKREEFRTLDEGVYVDPGIVNAWSKVLLAKWATNNQTDRLILDVVEQVIC